MNANYEEVLANNTYNDECAADIGRLLFRRMDRKSPEELRRCIILRIAGEYDRLIRSDDFFGRIIAGFKVYYCYVDQEFPFGRATVPIKREIAGRLELSEPELFELAIRNTPRIYPPKLESLEGYLKFCGSPIQEGLESEVYILSNQEMRYGANVILYPEVPGKLSKVFDGDFWILPSSIHELLLVPFIDSSQAEALSEMVKVVNNTVVSDEEILDYNVRLFRKDLNSVLSPEELCYNIRV